MNLDGLRMKNCLGMSALPLELRSVVEDEGGRCSGRDWEQGFGASGDTSAVALITHRPTPIPHSRISVALEVINEATAIC